MKTLPGIRTLLAVIALTAFAGGSFAQPFRVFDYRDFEWRYNDVSTSAANPSGLFQAPDFDDTGADWKSGRALFGNDDNGVFNGVGDPFVGQGLNGFTTPLGRLINGTAARVTFYFRAHFNFPTNPANVILYTTNYLDDGFVVYLNGVEAGRFRVPAAPAAINWDTLGSNPAAEGVAEFIQLSAASLVEGDNVIAVEVHQSSAGSSDVAFAMQLTAIIPFPPSILNPTEPADRVVQENRSTTLRVFAQASPPITYQWFKDNVEITGATSPTYDIPLMASTDAGAYFCRVSNPVGSVDSRTATVGYTEDTTPPTAVSALGNSTFDVITLAFDHKMDPTSIQDNFNYTIDDGSGGIVNVSGTALAVNGYVATLNTEAPMAPDTLYTITFGGLTDLAGNLIAEGSSIQFRTFKPGCGGGALFEAYNTGGGNAVSMILTNVNFPNNPQDVGVAPTFDSRHVYSDNSHEGFGARMRALFVPPVSGNWIFYLRSDDAGELWFNPAGPGAAGKIKIAEEISCCGGFEPSGAPETSLPQPLTAGNAYYIEALYKEGTGGDWLKIAARLEGDPVPPSAGDGGIDPEAISASMLGYPAGPAAALAGVTIGTQPADTTVLLGSGAAASFRVVMSPDVPACFQWKRDGVDIPGAVGQNYRFTPTAADDGAKFSVAISLMGGHSHLSTEATLTVIEDTTRPTLVGASTDVNRTNIVVTFSETVDAVSAGATGNYSIAGSTVQSATVSGASVTLGVNPPVATCVTHTLTVTGVKDPSGNFVNPNPATTTFVAPIVVLPILGHPWRYDENDLELGDAWYAFGFDDSGWSNGISAFGFETAAGVPPVATTNAFFRSTVYYRTLFTLPTAPSTVTNLQLSQYLDDGAVYYLNGVELIRSRMPAGPVTTATLADAGGPEPSNGTHTLEVLTVPAGALRSGNNVLAARVHQNAANSSDLFFAAGLTAFITGCQADVSVSISNDNGTITINAVGGGTIHKASNITGPWTAVGPGPIVITPAQQQPQEFFQIRP